MPYWGGFCRDLAAGGKYSTAESEATPTPHNSKSFVAVKKFI